MALAEAGISRREAGRLSGIAERTLARYTTGERDTPLLVLFQIAPHLDTTPDEILIRARELFEKRTGRSWGDHTIAAKAGERERDEQ
jgi:transcriptional regulator with XRE-family HTH domain